MSFSPPKSALRFLRWYCRTDYLDEIEGDLVELFERRAQAGARSKLRFWWDVIRSFRLINLKRPLLNNWTMNTLKNYSKIYFRRFRKEPVHYFVNILGLTLGFTVLLFIVLFVYDEQRFDAYHEDADNIYRVLTKSQTPEEGIVHRHETAHPFPDALEREFPEVEKATQLVYLGSSSLKKGDILFPERQYALTDNAVFDVLDFNILEGDPMKVPNGMGAVLSASTAKKLFGDKPAAGQMIEVPDYSEGSVEVLAVYEDFPSYSTYQFNVFYVVDFDYLKEAWSDGFKRWFNSWDSEGSLVFARFAPNTSPASVMDKKSAFMDKYVPKDLQAQNDFYFQNISDMHLGSTQVSVAYGPLLSVQYSSGKFVGVVSLIGLLVIIIAALNYINLSSVQALKRTHEAGIRKVNGATMGQLRFQLFTESFFTLFIANALAMLLVFFLHDQFQMLSDKQLPFAAFFTFPVLSYHVSFFLGIWILSSIVPALYYSKLSQSLVLKKNVFVGKGDTLRKTFVTVQFGISMVLILGSMIIYQQINYVQSKDLGFQKDQILTLDINSGAARKSHKQIVDALQKHPAVQNAAASSRVPGEWKWLPEVKLSTEKGQSQISGNHYAGDHYWFDTYNMTITQGSGFSGSDQSDTLKVVLNEKAVQALGLVDPIGKSIWVEEDTTSRMTIVGVIENFHFQSLHEAILPVVITSWNNPILSMDYFSIRYTGNPSDVIEHIETVQATFDPETPAEINFLDEKWDRYYKADLSRSNIILISTVVSIVISLFGLFGLVNFSAERRTKEVGIRKVMGASTAQIFRIVLKEYAILLLIALAISTPVAFWYLNDWLDGFAYRIELTVFHFLVAFIGIAVVSAITVTMRVYRLANGNPVNSLRYE